MKVLVVGSGGRCHAICDALSKSHKVHHIYAAPGNAGMMEYAELVSIKETQIEELVKFAQSNHIDLTVIGPEISLSLGIVDAFQKANLKVFGPTASAARIESSKEYAKDLMKKNQIPTADYAVFESYTQALQYCQNKPLPIVIKYDGLAAGKGVVIPTTFEELDNTLQEMLLNDKFGHGKVVIEEYLEGPEFSFMCFVNKNQVYPMPLAQDHKRAFDYDEGPNTGGMGAYSPLPFITEADIQYAYHEIMVKTAQALVEDGAPFTGVLYGGLMKTQSGIKVIEFNARFGDPETEVILPKLKSDIFDVFCDIIDENNISIEWSDKATVGIVLASKGYPGEYEKGYEISNFNHLDARVYHMGTKLENDKIVTNGGRVMIVVCEEDSLEMALEKCVTEVKKIKCDNLFYRTDIGAKAFK